MKHFHSQEDAQEFTSSLIAAVDEDIAEAIENMAPEDCVAFTREFLNLMEQWQPEAINLKERPLEGAAHGLYLAKMFEHCFQSAYLFSNRFLLAKESLQSVFKEDE